MVSVSVLPFCLQQNHLFNQIQIVFINQYQYRQNIFADDPVNYFTKKNLIFVKLIWKKNKTERNPPRMKNTSVDVTVSIQGDKIYRNNNLKIKYTLNK